MNIVPFIIAWHCCMHWPCWLRTWGGASSFTKTLISQSAQQAFPLACTPITLALSVMCRTIEKGTVHTDNAVLIIFGKTFTKQSRLNPKIYAFLSCTCMSPIFQQALPNQFTLPKNFAATATKQILPPLNLSSGSFGFTPHMHRQMVLILFHHSNVFNMIREWHHTVYHIPQGTHILSQSPK